MNEKSLDGWRGFELLAVKTNCRITILQLPILKMNSVGVGWCIVETLEWRLQTRNGDSYTLDMVTQLSSCITITQLCVTSHV